jgi:hypothetical protein
MPFTSVYNLPGIQFCVCVCVCVCARKQCRDQILLIFLGMINLLPSLYFLIPSRKTLALSYTPRPCDEFDITFRNHSHVLVAHACNLTTQEQRS